MNLWADYYVVKDCIAKIFTNINYNYFDSNYYFLKMTDDNSIDFESVSSKQLIKPNSNQRFTTMNLQEL